MDISLLPRHLRPLADDLARDVDRLTMTLRCPCGCTGFRLEEAVPSQAEQAAIDEWRAADAAVRRWRIVRYRKDESGKRMMMCRRFPFGRWEPLQPLLPEAPCCMDVLALRAVCRSCGKRHLICDNRMHGMDALAGGFTGEALRRQSCGQEIPLQEGAVLRVNISHDDEMTETEYREFIPGYTPDMACEAFAFMDVWSEFDGQPDQLLFESM